MATDTLTATSRTRRLDPLRGQLDAVRRRRLLGRRLTAWSAVLVAVLAALLGCLAIDRLFSLSRVGRLWLWAGLAAAVIWAFRRYAWPLLRIRESELDVALSMEKAHGIDSDFVAALQFERPDAQAWGSSTLRAAVVEYVAEFGREWTSAAPLWNRILAGRAGWAAALLAVFAALGIAAPGMLGAFVSRMALGAAHYPTWTRIERLVIAGHDIAPAAGGTIAAPAGRPLAIEVRWAGRPPRDGRAEFVPDSGSSARVPLAAETDAAAPSAVLRGELPNLTESATVVVHAGDAWSEGVRIRAVPTPVIEANLRVEPPAYARDATAAASAGRQAAVLEGSAVTIEVDCLNKRLDRAAVVIDGAAHPLERRQAADGRPRFVLSGSGSPLAAVTAPVQYEIRAVDEDGLSPDTPPTGTIRIRPDAPPQITVDAVTRAVLPTARPTITYSVRDDYGVAAVRAKLEVIRGGADADAAADSPSPAVRVVEVRGDSAPPLVGAALPAAGAVALPLAEFGLRKGDFVRVTVEAVDYRGPAPGQAATSGAIDLAVTDETGVLAALESTESQAAQELQTIIDDQLRVGDKP